MPFTPFHLGPGLGIGLPLRKYVHATTFIVANVILDVEPFLVLYLGLDYPLHGYLHSLLSALLVGLILGYSTFKLERFIQPFYRKILLEPNSSLSMKSFLAAGVLGTVFHVLLDSPLYADIRPFYPLSTNPFYSPSFSASLGIAVLCIWMGIFGIIYYSALMMLSAHRRSKHN